jgi:hypothetical protein
VTKFISSSYMILVTLCCALVRLRCSMNPPLASVFVERKVRSSGLFIFWSSGIIDI